MKVKLHQIADVFPGHNPRAREGKDVAANAEIFQARDIADLEGASLQQGYVKPSSKAVLRDNDIVIVVGGRHQARMIPDVSMRNNGLMLVPSHALIIIRVNNSLVLPKFLEAFLNSDLGQRKLAASAEGNIILTLRKEGLQQLEVEIPEVDEQERVAKLAECIEQQEALLKCKVENLQKIKNGMVMKTVEGER